MNTIFLNSCSFCFILNGLEIFVNICRYPGVYRLMLDEETKTELGRPERFFENPIFVICFEKINTFVKNQKSSMRNAILMFFTYFEIIFGSRNTILIDS